MGARFLSDVGDDRRVLAELLIAHDERAVVRVGDVYIKADIDSDRLGREVAALRTATVPRPDVLWHRRAAVSLLALSTVPGVPLAVLGAPSPHADHTWALAGHIWKCQPHLAPL